jgi:proline iminopeptidase
VDNSASEKQGRIVVHPTGYEVFYRTVGDGQDTLLVLHGGPGVSHRYLDRLTELAGPALKVVFYDQLGSGDSDWPPEEETDLWSVPRFVREVETVRAELDLGAVHVLGQSWGGNLALQYALEYPSYVKSLVLSNTGASAPEIAHGMAGLKVELGHELGAETFARAMRHEALGELDDPEYQEWVLNLYSRHLRRSTPFDAERSRREFQEIAAPLMEQVGPAYRTMWGPNEFVCTGGEIEFDVRERLGEVAVPALILCGWYDELIVDVSRTMAAGLPDNEFVIFGNSSHFTILEKEAELYLGAIANFLSRQTGMLITPASLRDSTSNAGTAE